jgi:hypothetical protein
MGRARLGEPSPLQSQDMSWMMAQWPVFPVQRTSQHSRKVCQLPAASWTHLLAVALTQPELHETLEHRPKNL